MVLYYIFFHGAIFIFIFVANFAQLYHNGWSLLASSSNSPRDGGGHGGGAGERVGPVLLLREKTSGFL